jgi:hypothetical protein
MNPTAPLLTLDHLEALAAQVVEPVKAASTTARPPAAGRGWDPAEIEAALTQARFEWEEAARPWGTLYRLSDCLTSREHEDGASIGRLASGAWWYRCHHNSCQDKRWAEARAALGLDTLRLELGGSDAPKGAKTTEECQPSKVGTLGKSWHPSAGLVRLADVVPEAVRWLWRQRVPRGKLTILDGDPGLGKSLITIDIAARVTRHAAMPDGTLPELEGPGGVVLLSAEDGLADTIRPRLEAAGADISRVVALAFVQDTQPGSEADPARVRRLPTLADLEALREAITAVDAKVVIIDPLMAYLPGTTNAHRDQDVRQILAQLAALAEETGVALIVVRHLNKAAGGNPLYRGGGSIGIIGAARSGLLVAKDPDDETEARRVLVPTKSNLSAPAPALAYHLEPGEGEVVRVVWDGPSEHTAAALLEASGPASERSALEEAAAVLDLVLADGPRPVKEVEAEAKAAGIKERTLDRAKKQLGVKAHKDGFSGGWYWSRPAKGAKDAEGCQGPGVGTLRESWHPSELPDEVDELDRPRPPVPRDPGGWCEVHQRLFTYREQMAQQCSWCRALEDTSIREETAGLLLAASRDGVKDG